MPYVQKLRRDIRDTKKKKEKKAKIEFMQIKTTMSRMKHALDG